MGKYRKKKKKRIVEIKTRSKGWYRVELLEVKNNNVVKLRLPSGEIINRKAKNIRYEKSKKRSSTSDRFANKKDLKRYKKKKTAKKKKSFAKKHFGVMSLSKIIEKINRSKNK